MGAVPVPVLGVCVCGVGWGGEGVEGGGGGVPVPVPVPGWVSTTDPGTGEVLGSVPVLVPVPLGFGRVAEDRLVLRAAKKSCLLDGCSSGVAKVGKTLHKLENCEKTSLWSCVEINHRWSRSSHVEHVGSVWEWLCRLSHEGVSAVGPSFSLCAATLSASRQWPSKS